MHCGCYPLSLPRFTNADSGHIDHLFRVMPALVAGIPFLLRFSKQDWIATTSAVKTAETCFQYDWMCNRPKRVRFSWNHPAMSSLAQAGDPITLASCGVLDSR
jgi:hypothetical protein